MESDKIDHDRIDSDKMYHIHFASNEHDVTDVASDLFYL